MTDRAGNTSTATVSGINIDSVAPHVVVSRSVPAPNAHGWYNTPVTVTFVCTDATSGVAAGTCPDPQVLGNGKHPAQQMKVTDNAGNSTTVTVPEIDVDTAAPDVAFTGNTGQYTVDQTVNITCTATDALSGIDAANTSCPSVHGPAYMLPLGKTVLTATATATATATDNAGNAKTVTTSYTVAVTCPSLENLVSSFSTDAGVATGLNAKLDAACKATTAQAKAGQIGAFDNQVRAQTGKALTSEQANVLARLAGSI